MTRWRWRSRCLHRWPACTLWRADDWRANRQTCIDVLRAYLRMPYEPDPGEGGTGGGAAGSLASGVSASELAVALGHQHLASPPLIAQRPAPGSQLLIGLSRIARSAIAQQPKPSPGRNRLGNTRVGEPINRQPPARIGRVLQPCRTEPKRAARLPGSAGGG
jgi:hypothetical protein